MPRRRPRRHLRPLRATIGERFGRTLEATPLAHRIATLPAPPPRSARDVLTLLLAATGLSLAARKDAAVELLPGSPTTIVITASGQAHAAFVLPVSEVEAAKLVGGEATVCDRAADVLWEESRFAEMQLPDSALDLQRELAWGDA